MRLDFDDDGTVTMDDLKMSMVHFYEFLKEFDVIDATYQIKGKLYTDAIAYMQQELEQDQKQRETRQKEMEETKKAQKAEAANGAPQAADDLKKTNWDLIASFWRMPNLWSEW